MRTQAKWERATSPCLARSLASENSANRKHAQTTQSCTSRVRRSAYRDNHIPTTNKLHIFILPLTNKLDIHVLTDFVLPRIVTTISQHPILSSLSLYVFFFVSHHSLAHSEYA